MAEVHVTKTETKTIRVRFTQADIERTLLEVIARQNGINLSDPGVSYGVQLRASFNNGGDGLIAVLEIQSANDKVLADSDFEEHSCEGC